MSRKGAPFHCTFEDCTASFSRSDRLQNHLRIHTGKNPFVCDYEECDKSYPSSASLKKHVQATHENSFRCTVKGCLEILKTKQTLKKHIDGFHLKKKPKVYKCSECDKEFNKHSWLQSHMFKHTSVYPHKCTFEGCEKGFLLPSKLKAHMKTHEGRVCKVPGCGKVFFKWSLFVAHLKENHPPVHQCEICDRKFSTSTNLKNHREMHKLSGRKVFACEMPNCTRFYLAEKNLKFHVKHYHAARPHVCDKENCHRAFKTREELDDHMSRHTRRKPRKKKKYRPSFSAVLSGCADPRKFTRRMPAKPIVSESSDEFSSDEEVSYQDMSSEETTPKKSHPEIIDITDMSSEENSPKNYNPEIINLDDQVPDNQAGPFNSGDSQSIKIIPYKRVESDSTDMDSSYEEPSSNTTGAYKNRPTTLTGTEQLNRKSVNKLPNKRMRLETCASFDGHQGNSAIENSDIAPAQSLTDLKSMDGDASSSEYETITVSVFGNSGYKSCSGSEEVSSCLSEAEELLGCDDMCSGRER